MHILLIICGTCLMLYSGFVLLSSWHFYHENPPSVEPLVNPPFISVIIPARNEEADIEACLLSVLQQEYAGRFEVILVDDQSTDNTHAIAQQIAQRFPHLSLISSEKPGKKSAIAKGISLAKGELIFQTDADCKMGIYWLQSMSRSFEENIAFVSGPIALEYQGSFFQPLQALESMGLVVLGAGFLLAGRPNMANGANMAYRKSVFEELKGFEGVDHVASGDDEFLLQKISMAKRYELAFCKDHQATVRTSAAQSWQAFKSQRIRWVSKVKAYVNKGPNVIQGISYLAFWIFPLLLLGAFFDIQYLWIFAGAFLLKGLIDLILMYQAARFFHNLSLLRWFLPLQLVYIPYVIWIGLAGLFVKNYSWKGRTVV